jgi:phage terminase large subunit
VDYEAYQVGCAIQDTPSLFLTVPGAEQWPIISDSARPETIDYMKKHGFPHMVPALKGAGSVEDGIAWLQSHDIVVHPRCKNLIEELKTYAYKRDSLTDAVLPILEDKNNHVIDSLRYACESVRRLKKKPDWRPIQYAQTGIV